MARLYFFISFFLYISFYTKGQDHKSTFIKNPTFFGFNFHPLGYIVPHTSELRQVDLRNPLGLQADFGWHLNTRKSWNQCKCYPRTGFSALVFDYRNKSELGRAYNLTGFIEPFFGFNNKVKTSFRLGAGITYLNQVYDSITNPNNLFYSAPISFMLRTQLNLHYTLNENWELKAAGHFQHISNGGISQPNKGMNFPTLSVGMVYLPQGVQLLQRKATKLDSLLSSKWQHRVFLTTGLKEISITNEQKYPAFGITFYTSRIISRINALHLGISHLWDGSIDELKRQTNNNVNENAFSIIGGNEFLMGKFIFSQTLGVYLRKPTEDTENIYHRWGLYYRVFNKGLVGVNLKAHRHVADILDFRVGYTW